MRMTRYAVYRHGSNASNQGMRQTQLVAIVEAQSRDAAVAVESVQPLTVHQSAHMVLAPCVTVWANQWLTALPASQAPAADLREFAENEAMGDGATPIASAHTQGPWKKEKRNGPTIHVTGPRAAPGMPGGVFKHAPGNIVAFVHDDADANLISAAPELLAALENIGRWYSNGITRIDFEKAIAALAKARGE